MYLAIDSKRKRLYSYGMTLTLRTSLDWAQVDIELTKRERQSKKHQHDLYKMRKAIGDMVKQLSIEELNCRRVKRQTQYHAELLERINKSIHDFELMVTFGLLL